LEVPTIDKAYFLGLNFREYPHNSYGQKYGTFTYLHLLDPGISIALLAQDGSVSLRSKSSDKYLAAEHPKWGVATADREEIDDWEKFNVTTVHGWDTATLVGWLRCGGGDSGGSYIMVILMGCNGDLMGCNRISW